MDISISWLVILFFIAAIISAVSYFVSNNKSKKKINLIIKNEKSNLEEIIANSDSKLTSIKKIRLSYNLGTIEAIEVYAKIDETKNKKSHLN
ncbi:hypothetical protein RD055328_10030 [Companilactobacillus sp. RD055328]|uniref:hypothetical protein n=1 Tax=Companilactobacillus sp. RD055328 TaxID=2916634 RepID=UPI001FC80621|nr:hypothetical protein [Companilactobacillus sp. RD055328]GKQ43080.1 hypothetical protein RD055328_10030 [Companilactobacillus sp. RD055328]